MEPVLNKIEEDIHYAMGATVSPLLRLLLLEVSVKLRPRPITKQAKIRVRPRGMENTIPPSSGKRNPLSSMPPNSAYQGYTKPKVFLWCCPLCLHFH